MNCSELQEQIFDYLDQVLEQDRIVQFEEHLEF